MRRIRPGEPFILKEKSIKKDDKIIHLDGILEINFFFQDAVL